MPPNIVVKERISPLFWGKIILNDSLSHWENLSYKHRRWLFAAHDLIIVPETGKRVAGRKRLALRSAFLGIDHLAGEHHFSRSFENLVGFFVVSLQI
jgi:hypothetical protein